MLDTFVLVHKNEILSPHLVTIRCYGNWMKEVFDEYTVKQELYMKSAKKGDASTLEWHPGTRIGDWFEKHDVGDAKYKSWYIYKDSYAMDRLVKLKLAEYKDAVPLQYANAERKQMIRVYTAEQIELYIRSNLDRNFRIGDYISNPVQVGIKDTQGFIKPDFKKVVNKLF